MTTALPPLRVGTRRSDLARWQANHVVDRIGSLAGSPATEMVYIKTEGDRITDIPLHSVPGKSFFTKDIEQALLDDRIDIAVHSLKDLATDMPDGLAIGAVLEREDPRDVLLSQSGASLEELPAGARLGTSSLRRRALIARWRSDLELVDLRGNVPTRIAKLKAGEFDAIVLAAAGVKRLGFDADVAEYLPLEHVLPAVAQGAVALQVRQGDERVLNWAGQLDHAATRQATAAERALLNRLEGGCQVPVGALAGVAMGELSLRAVVCSLDGERSVEAASEGGVDKAEHVGRALADTLWEQGAKAILGEIRAASGDAR